MRGFFLMNKFYFVFFWEAYYENNIYNFIFYIF